MNKYTRWNIPTFTLLVLGIACILTAVVAVLAFNMRASFSDSIRELVGVTFDFGFWLAVPGTGLCLIALYLYRYTNYTPKLKRVIKIAIAGGVFVAAWNALAWASALGGLMT